MSYIKINESSPGHGPGKRPVSVALPAADKDRRVSPNPQTAPGETKTHWEYMEKGRIREKDGRTITIDIDRDGGVFLDHGELARILAGKKDEMIKEINDKIEDAQTSYRTNEGIQKKFYRVVLNP